jgi:hypothetical protein
MHHRDDVSRSGLGQLDETCVWCFLSHPTFGIDRDKREYVGELVNVFWLDITKVSDRFLTYQLHCLGFVLFSLGVAFSWLVTVFEIQLFVFSYSVFCYPR